MQINEQDVDRVYLGLNRYNLIHKILVPKYNGNIRRCAEAIGLRPNYLRDLIGSPTRDAGTRTLTTIYHYCRHEGLDPEDFIFVLREADEEVSS